MDRLMTLPDGSVCYLHDLEPVPSKSGLSQRDKIECLEGVSIFQGCSRRQLRALARITEEFDAPAGTILTRAGDPGEEFFVIVEGAARVHVSLDRRRRLQTGDYFGEMSLLDRHPRSATVVAETPVRLLAINRRSFATLLDEVPGFIHRLLVTLSRRVRNAEQTLHA